MPFGIWTTSKMVAKQMIMLVLFVALAGWVLWTYQDQIRGLISGIPTPPVVIEKEGAELYPRLLDGVLVEELATSTITAVMLDNAPEAWPHRGLSAAHMVWEIPVEGPRTRLMALYDLGYLEDVSIGPVRSVRPYFLSVAKSYDATILHVGGSPEALDLISEGYVDSLNEFGRGNYFWRSKKRWAPHNVITSDELIKKADEKFEFDAPMFDPLLYADIEIQKLVSPSYVFGELAIDWRYDGASQLYTRYQSNKPFVDDSDEITASNVVIMYAPMTILDNELRRGIGMVGEGDVDVYRAGGRIEGTWSRSSDDETTRFFDENGDEIEFSRGVMWVSVLPPGWSIETRVEG